jgi:hypothetical protein
MEYLQQYRFILLFLLLEKYVQKKVITEIWEKQPGKRPLERMVRPAQRGLKSKRGPSSSSPLRDILLAKWLSFADESFKFRRAACTVQQMQCTFMDLGHALSIPVFYYSLQLNVDCLLL